MGQGRLREGGNVRKGLVVNINNVLLHGSGRSGHHLLNFLNLV